jgi:hypothetical protein
VILDTKEAQHNYGEHPTGYIQYSPGGHLVMFITTGDLKRPATASYTDAERSEIYKGIAGGYAGTYTIQGNKVIHHLLTAWRPEWVGSDQTRNFEIEGKHLTITRAPIKNQMGQDVVAVLIFEKVEYVQSTFTRATAKHRIRVKLISAGPSGIPDGSFRLEPRTRSLGFPPSRALASRLRRVESEHGRSGLNSAAGSVAVMAELAQEAAAPAGQDLPLRPPLPRARVM